MNTTLVNYPKNGVYYRGDPLLQNKANKVIAYLKTLSETELNSVRKIELEFFKSRVKRGCSLTDINNFFARDFDNIINMHKVEKFIDYMYDIIPDGRIPFDASFIVFEGCDGVGKDYIVDKLNLSKYDILFTREPGGSEMSELIRNIILDNTYTHTMSYRTEFLLYCASRAQHVDQIIIPALQAGSNVISNRFYHSSLIYQKLRGIDDFYLKTLTEFAINNTHPDMVFSLYNNDNIIMDRLNNKSKDRLEHEPDEFYSNVNKQYRDIEKNKLIKSISNSEYTIYKTIDTSSKDAITDIEISLSKILYE